MQLHHPDLLPTFAPALLGLGLAVVGLGVLTGCAYVLLIAAVIFGICTLVPLPTVLVALTAGLGVPLGVEMLRAGSLLPGGEGFLTSQIIALGSVGALGTLLRRFLRRIEWRLATQSVFATLQEADTSATPNTVITQALCLLRDFARADAAIALHQLDEMTAEALVCLPKTALPDKLTSPKLFAEALEHNRCLYYPDYPSTTGAARVLLAKGAKSVAVLPLSSAGSLRGAILLIWYRRIDFPSHLQSFIDSLLGSLRTLLRFQDTTLRLDKLQARLGAMLETIHQGVVFVDESGEQGWINQAAARLLGLTPGAVEPAAIAQAMAKLRYRADNNQKIAAQAAQFFAQPEAVIRDWHWIFTNPQPLVLNISSTPTRILNVPGRLWVLDDITVEYLSRLALVERTQQLSDANEELEKAAAQQAQLYEKLAAAHLELQHLATLDGLTRLANRRCFDQSLEQEWRRLRREQSPLSLILMDVDFFKLYNDTYGHLAGDFCLQEVAKAIRSAVKRPADMVARYGGEEFVVILPNTDVEGAVKVGETIRSALKALQIDHRGSLVSEYVSLSLGVATIIPHFQAAPDRLIAAADAALYQAKVEGRDRVVAATPILGPVCDLKPFQHYQVTYSHTHPPGTVWASKEQFF